MSTTGVESWAVDLAEVGAIYPFQGLEWLFALLVVGGWLGWHVWQIRWEQEYHRQKRARYADMLRRDPSSVGADEARPAAEPGPSA